jgi:glucose-fructose oxidoreductase
MKSATSKKIRYAVVGLGDLSQRAILPAFANARKNSELVGLISDDPRKLDKLSKLYRVPDTCSYRDYDTYLRSNRIDAVYIVLPNSLHADYAIRAAKAGIHVLCEKPLARTEGECQDMIAACAENRVKLMAAYRLHFERANLEAIRLVQSGTIGEPRIFQALFTQQVKPGNIRLRKALGGGTLCDIGVYCINAARYIFRAEPTEVFAFTASNEDPRFKEVEEMSSAILRFPDNRLADFSVSFGAAPTAVYTVMGTKGSLRMVHGFEYSKPIVMEITTEAGVKKRQFALRDQFAPELLYFSDCILKNREPEPSGIEGLLDVHIVQSLYQSAKAGIPVRIHQLLKKSRPSMRMEIHREPAKRVRTVDVASPTR